MKFGIAIAFALTACLLVPATGTAADGNYTQILCFNPDTGRGVGTPEEVRMTQTRQPYGPLRSSCGGPLEPNKGLWISSGLAGGGIHTNDLETGEMTYEAPADVTLLGGHIYRFWLAPSVSPARQVMTVHGGDSGIYWGTAIAEQANWYHAIYEGAYPWASRGNSSVPLSANNRVSLVIGGAKRWRVTLACDSGSQRIGCDVWPGEQEYRIFAGKLSLSDTAGPSIGSTTGPLATNAELAGSVDADISASDQGAGVYRIRLLVDNQIVSESVADSNNGACVDVNPANSDAYEFGSATPCKRAASGEVSLNTLSYADGSHNVKIQVEDAAGNRAVALNRTVLVRNARPPADQAGPSANNGVDGGTSSRSLGDGGPWALTFRLSKRRLRNGQLLKYSGTLSGGSRSRRFVDVQVRKTRRRWQVVCSVQTDASGAYSCRHRFKRTHRKTRYVFRARMRGQAGASAQTIVTASRAAVVRP